MHPGNAGELEPVRRQRGCGIADASSGGSQRGRSAAGHRAWIERAAGGRAAAAAPARSSHAGGAHLSAGGTVDRRAGRPAQRA